MFAQRNGRSVYMTAAYHWVGKKRERQRGKRGGGGGEQWPATHSVTNLARHFDPLSSIARVKIDTICPLTWKGRRDRSARLKNAREVAGSIFLAMLRREFAPGIHPDCMVAVMRLVTFQANKCRSDKNCAFNAARGCNGERYIRVSSPNFCSRAVGNEVE